MNKIIMSNNSLVLNNEEIFLDLKTNEINININGKVIVNEIVNNIDNRTININIEDNSSLIYNRFGNNLSGLCNIKINGEYKSKIEFKNSFIASDKYELIINNEISKNKNDNILNIHGVAINNGVITINATGIIKEKTIDNNYIENIKILSLNELEHTIIPNLIVESNEVNAIHNATISSISENDLYYLKRLSLSKKTSIKLIRDGFLIGNLKINNEIYTKIKEIL